jgi:2-methylcitrate dehydratase
MGIARGLAKYTSSLTFPDLPPDVLHQTKRVVLDTLGCAIEGYDSKTNRSIQELIKELDHPEEATIFCSAIRTSCLNAALANGAMVRYLDYNDTAFILQGETYRTGYHPSKLIAPS